MRFNFSIHRKSDDSTVSDSSLNLTINGYPSKEEAVKAARTSMYFMNITMEYFYIKWTPIKIETTNNLRTVEELIQNTSSKIELEVLRAFCIRTYNNSHINIIETVMNLMIDNIDNKLKTI